MAHADLGVKSSKHKPGCVTAHVTTYVEGNTCSHRWQAAKRARADTRIEYPSANDPTSRAWKATKNNLAKLETWTKTGKASGVARKRGKAEFTLAPFATWWWPWKNNAHHIIPRSVLAGVLEKIASKAEPHEHRTFDVMIHGLLGEEYNLNGEPNVMMLPVRNDDAIAMGLPRHLQGSGTGTVDHPKYNRAVHKQVWTELKPKYKAMVTAIKARKHQGRDEAPAVRPVLEAISQVTYDAIIAQAAAHREAGATDVTLDSIARTLFCSERPARR